MPEWPTVEFQALAAESKSAFSKPYGSAITREDYVETGVPVVRGVNLRNGIFLDDEFVFISDAKADQMPGANLTSGDLVFTHRGTIGQVSMVPWNRRYSRYVLSTSQVKARLNPRVAIPEFYYYWFTSPRGQHEILSNISTVGVPGLVQPVATVKSLRVPWPPLPAQAAISSVLEALDDKIAVNDRIALRCKELALAYGICFLRECVGEEVALSDYADTIKGVSYRSADLAAGSSVLVTLKCVGRNGEFQSEGMKPFNGEHKDQQILSEGELIVAQTDLTQRAEVIGRPVRVLRFVGDKRMVASLDLAIVRPRELISREVLFALLSTQDFRDHAISYCNGTTVLHMGAKAVPEFRFAKPSAEIIASATKLMTPLLLRSDQARYESRCLSMLRGTLLPKLMSGEIRVREAEAIVGDAT
jgi:type I restriction enzyme S subunit